MSVKVIKNEINPESTEILAEAIVRIGGAMKKLEESGLNRDAIIILIMHKTKLGWGTVSDVLDALSRLRGWYCK